MGEVLSFPNRRPHLVSPVRHAPLDDEAGKRDSWLARQMSEAIAALAIATTDIAEVQKLFHQQGTNPKLLINADTIESIVLGLVPTIHLCGMSNRDRALYAALLHWLHGHQGGDHAC